MHVGHLGHLPLTAAMWCLRFPDHDNQLDYTPDIQLVYEPCLITYNSSRVSEMVTQGSGTAPPSLHAPQLICGRTHCASSWRGTYNQTHGVSTGTIFYFFHLLEIHPIQRVFGWKGGTSVLIMVDPDLTILIPSSSASSNFLIARTCWDMMGPFRPGHDFLQRSPQRVQPQPAVAGSHWNCWPRHGQLDKGIEWGYRWG